MTSKVYFFSTCGSRLLTCFLAAALMFVFRGFSNIYHSSRRETRQDKKPYVLGAPPPCVMQNDFSIINRRVEENGLTEASSPVHENVGFMAYNVLAGQGIRTPRRKVNPSQTDEA